MAKQDNFDKAMALIYMEAANVQYELNSGEDRYGRELSDHEIAERAIKYQRLCYIMYELGKLEE